MRVSLKWLREYTAPAQSAAEIAYKLTMAGVEVVTVNRVGESWDHVSVARVAKLERHPNADRLQLVTVDLGTRSMTVVTGATNLTVGDKVPFAEVGAVLWDAHVTPPVRRELKPAKLRGIESAGMVCSALELGLGEDHAGILILDPSATVGVPLAEELGDVILDIDVKANRSDCLSMLGVAREVAALTGAAFQAPEIKVRAEGPPIDGLVAVEIADPDLCARYTASVVQGVRIAESPRWLRDRLTAAGVRPINNVVDATNYVMLEYGQPLHAFDYDRIHGRQIVVRRAGDDERMTTLDGAKRELTPEILVIADKERPVAVAGVMGGADSEVTEATTNVLLESATFNPISIRKTARALRLPSEASRRFERGVPSRLAILALERATRLIHELAGGTVARGFADAYPRPAETVRILLTPAEIERILGQRVDLDYVVTLLDPLGFVGERAPLGLLVTVPMHRLDVTLPCDLVEEIARMIGYDNLPTSLPADPQPEPVVNREWEWSDIFRETMVGLGYNEVLTYSLTSRERLGRLLGASGRAAGPSSFMAVARGDDAADVDGALGGAWRGESDVGPSLAHQITDRFVPIDVAPVRLLNPLTSDAECLRTTSFAGLLETLRANLRTRSADVHLFEIGRIYVPRGAPARTVADPTEALPAERRVLTAVAGARRSAPAWGQALENDFFWMKAATEAILTRAGIADRVYRPVEHPVFHPTRAAAIVIPGAAAGGDLLIGVIGEVEHDVRAAFDVDERAYLFCLDLDRIIPRATRLRSYHPLPKFPPVAQDLAIVVSTEYPAHQIEELIRAAGMPLLRGVELFDIYQGDPVPSGKIGLGFHLTYQALDRTLTDAEVRDVQRRIEQALQGEIGAELRA